MEINDSTKVLVTGATGFVGKALVAQLSSDPRIGVRQVQRRGSISIEEHADIFEIDDLEVEICWQAALHEVGMVVHLAARVHIMDDRSDDALEKYRRINVHATLNLARQAAAAGVRRFIFISSIKVNGEATGPQQPFTAECIAGPADNYAISKHEAETALQQLATETAMEVVIIRPPLIYGAGVKANFLAMTNWIRLGRPFPFARTRNKRSMVGIGNLVDLIRTCLYHPNAGNQIFLVSDGRDLSTSELIIQLGIALNRPANLIPLPLIVSETMAAAIGKKKVISRLFSSLQVDINKTRRLLDWTPPYSVEESILEFCKIYLNETIN